MAKPPLLTQDELDSQLAALNANAQSAWAISEGKLNRRYEFASFSDAFGFMAQSALACESLDHHPRWVNVWNVVEISLLTHRAGGITHLDFDLAGKMESIAKKLLT